MGIEIILFVTGLAILAYFYIEDGKRREFREVRHSNPKLWKKIEKEASTHFDKTSQPLQQEWDDLTRKIYAEYKKDLAMGLTVKQIYKERKKKTFGPWAP